MDFTVLRSVMLLVRTTFATLEMDSTLWDVKMNFMELLVTIHQNATGTPAIVRKRVQMTDIEKSVIYPVVRVVQVDEIETLVCV